MPSRFLRWVCALSLAGGALATAPRANALEISLSQPNPDRSSPNNDLRLRGQARNPNGINFDDCVKDIILEFPLRVVDLVPGTQFQVWTSSDQDCTDRNNRTAPLGRCNAVTQMQTLNQAAFRVSIKGRNIVQYVGMNTQSTFTDADISACSKQTVATGTKMKLYFLPLDTSGNAAGTPATYELLVDTMGPPAPTPGGPIGLGDTLLKVRWTPANDSDTAGFRIFCDPKPGNEHVDVFAPPVDTGVPDTGSSLICPDAGEEDADTGVDLDACVPAPVDSGAGDDAGSGGGTCGSTVLENGVNGSALGPEFQCGDIADKGASEFTVGGLTNGVSYTFAVAATDISDNAGPMTVIGCESPQSVDDFWKKYREAGGRAGGGFCALEAVGMSAGSSVFALVMIGGAVAAARRRRRS